MGFIVALILMFFAWSFVFDIGVATLGSMFASIQWPPGWGGGLAVFLSWYLLGIALQYLGVFAWGQMHQEIHLRRMLRMDRLAHQAAIQQASGEEPPKKKRNWWPFWVILAIIILAIIGESQ